MFDSIQKRFSGPKVQQQWEIVERVNKVRNTYIAHSEKELTDPQLARSELKHWISALAAMYEGN